MKSKKIGTLCENLMEILEEGIILIDMGLKIIYINSGACDFLGYGHSNLIGKSIADYIYNKEMESFDGAFNEPGEKLTIKEIAWKTRNKGKTVAETRFSPLFGEDETPHGFVIVLGDESSQALSKTLGDLKRSHTALMAAFKELKTIEKLKTDIISNVSHELRTPLTVAKGAIELALVEDDEVEKARLLEMARKALLRQNNTIGDLVDVSEMTRHGYDLRKINIDLEALIFDIIEEVRWQAKEKDIKIKFEVREDMLEIYVDKTQIRHLFLNLMENAIKFNKVGGKIHIKASCEPDSSFVTIKVKDTGCGFDTKDVDKIFEPFHQLDSSTTRRYGGIGLGLYFVKRVLNAHDGLIKVKSKIGVGTEFEIKLRIENRQIRQDKSK